MTHISAIMQCLFYDWLTSLYFMSFGASLVAQVGKNLPANAGDPGSVPGLGRSPGEGDDNPLQYSCLGNPMDRGTCWATEYSPCGCTELDMTQ